jgi:cell division protein FtsN
VRAPTEPSAGGEVKNADQLTNEQRQLLAQMQADMRQQPTQLNEVPWNEQTPQQRQQTLQRQRQVQQQVQQQQQQQWTQTQPVQQPRTQPRVTEQPYQQPQQQTRTVQTQPVQQPPKTQTQKPATSTQPYQDLLQTPAHTAAQQPKAQPQQSAPVAQATEAPKQTAEKKDERRWMVQCGSFKGAEQAETVRAQLAFEGFDSRITTNNGWNRVVIGPVKGKDNADGTISRLKIAGHTNCIRLASGG